jgi:hypothetical protein
VSHDLRLEGPSSLTVQPQLEKRGKVTSSDQKLLIAFTRLIDLDSGLGETEHILLKGKSVSDYQNRPEQLSSVQAYWS